MMANIQGETASLMHGNKGINTKFSAPENIENYEVMASLMSKSLQGMAE